MTLTCAICWQTILPDERHIVTDLDRGDGEHVECPASSFFRRRESRRSPGQPSQAPKGLVLRAAAPVGGNPSSCAAALPAAVAPHPPAVAPPRGRGARSTSTSLHAAPGRDGTRTGPCHAGGVQSPCAPRSEDIGDGRGVRDLVPNSACRPVRTARLVRRVERALQPGGTQTLEGSVS